MMQMTFFNIVEEILFIKKYMIKQKKGNNIIINNIKGCNMDVLEKDWKIYKQRLGDQQDRHIGRLLEEYREIIDSDLKNSDKFWEIQKRINEDRKNVGVVCRFSRSTMEDIITLLLLQGTITEDDLVGFSEELITSIKESRDYWSKK